MGNHKFRLSEMMQNSLFNRLKNMKKTSKSKYLNTEVKQECSFATTFQNPHLRQQPGSSYYFNRKQRMSGKLYTNSPSSSHFPDSPRRSSKRRSKRKTIYKPSPKLAYKCHDAKLSPLLVESSDYFVSSRESSPEPDILHEILISESESNSFASTEPLEGITALSSPFDCKFSSTTADIIIDMNDQSFTRETGELDEVDTESKIEFPPILTKLRNSKNDQSNASRLFSRKKKVNSRQPFSVKIVKDENIRTGKEHKTSHFAQKPPGSPMTGIRLRANSPKISSKKLQACARKSVSSSTGLKFKNKNLSGSFAVEKSSNDPQKDFRDSMMEMILEKDIRAAKDLEDLLACYLELNSNEYHDLIIGAFQQIWLDITDFQL